MQQINKIISSAKIITITDLVKGNVVKIIDTKYSDKKLKFGIVTDILRDNNDCYVTIITFEVGYGKVEIETKVFAGSDSSAIFPASKEEVNAEFSRIENSLLGKLREKEKELAEYKSNYELAKKFLNDYSATGLSSPQFDITE